MPYNYPEEIREQQAKVKRELKKLARMRVEYLIATGQMPSYKPNSSTLDSAENGSAPLPPAIESQAKPS